MHNLRNIRFFWESSASFATRDSNAFLHDLMALIDIGVRVGEHCRDRVVKVLNSILVVLLTIFECDFYRWLQILAAKLLLDVGGSGGGIRRRGGDSYDSYLVCRACDGGEEENSGELLLHLWLIVKRECIFIPLNKVTTPKHTGDSPIMMRRPSIPETSSTEIAYCRDSLRKISR